jgi:insulysin
MTTAATVTSSVAIEKSTLDNNSYRSITLSNNLTCLLISDPASEKSAAALDVNVGQSSDGEDIPGKKQEM